MPRPAANCSSPPARCLPGPICRSSRAQKAAIRACWSSCCAARSMGWRRSRPSAIRTGPRCAAITRSPSTASRPRYRSTLSLRSIPRCPTCIVSTRPARRRSCMPRRRLIGNAPISTARTCWRAACPSQARPTAAGSIGRLPRCNRRPAPVLSWTPRRLPPASGDTVMRLIELYRHTDPVLARALEERMGLATIARAGGMDGEQPRPPAAGQLRAYFAESAGTAAKFLARPDGPRIGALAFDGWDTHAAEGAMNGRLATLLSALDGAVAAIETEMNDAWRETLVAIITEVCPTARINPTDGTDHGTPTVALLAGGALKGGRVIADWPGLRPAKLHEGRDLKPTTELRAVLKGLLKDHLRVEPAALAPKGFPDRATEKPMPGLLH